MQLDLLEEIEKITKEGKKKSKELLEFKNMINQEPPEKLLKKNTQYGNMYIPLEVVEQMLLAIFDAHEVIMPATPKLIEGQILTVVNIVVHHPVLKKPLTYSGMSCVPLIAAEKDMKWNHRNIPAGKGFAIMNACKEIGRLFRAEHVDTSNVMAPYFEDKLNDSERSDEEKRMMELIGSVKTKASLTKLRPKCLKMSDEVMNMYNHKMKILKK